MFEIPKTKNLFEGNRTIQAKSKSNLHWMILEDLIE